MSPSDFIYEKEHSISRITFNRPEKLNAFRNKSRRELSALLDDFAKDNHSKVLILTGAGRAFCAGADLSELGKTDEAPFDEARHRAELDGFQKITQQIIALNKPVIAAINGIAIGVGLEIALACDIRIAASNVHFAFTEVKRGLFQTNGMMYLLPRLIGFGRAIELMMTGRTVEAAEAAAIGLISHTVSESQLQEQATGMATLLSEHAPVSLKLIKRIGWESLDADLPTVMEMEVNGMLECLKSEDMREGIAAFLEKRKPSFKGK